ncbi:MAG: hypothetical protein O9296_15120, partial [Novosphingobium sp.]|nr:hypothetical protein [Novosphingobium sp.]
MGAQFAPRMGLRWTNNFDVRVRYNGDPTNTPFSIRARMPDGREVNFVGSGGGFVPERSWNVERMAKVGTTYEMTDGNDTVYVFNYDGLLTTIRYRGGYTQTLAYNTSKQNTSVVDSFGRSITFAYNADKLLESATLPDGSVVRYTYRPLVNQAALAGFPGLAVGSNPAKILETVILPDGTPGNLNDNPRITYHYENTTFPSALTGITDERGIRLSTYVYDAAARVIETSWAGSANRYQFSYNDANLTTTITNPLGKQAIVSFAAGAGRRRMTAVLGQASTNCPSSTTAIAYDGNGFISSTTDEEGRVVAYVNDARGLPTSITRGSATPQAVATTFTWHATLRVPTQIVEPCLTTTYAWNATNGQLNSITKTDTTTHTVPYSTNGQTRVWAFTYGTGGRLLTVNGPLAGTGDTTTYAYNTNGFLTSVTNEVGHVTTLSNHNGRGQPQTVTDPNSIVTNLTYDERGRLLTVTANPGASQAVTTFAYNATGDITRITRPNGSYLDYIYDNARRLTAVQDNLSNRIEYDRDAMGGMTATRVKDSGGTIVRSQSQAFDELGRLIRIIGANSQTTAMSYDKVGNLTATTDPRSGVYGYAYDPLNRLIRETNEDSGQVNLTLNGRDLITTYSDPRSLQTTYVRNGFGEVIREVSPDRGTTTTTVNALGLPTQITDGRGIVENRTYDNAGRLLTRTFPAATAENVTITWDQTASGNRGIGRITQLVSQSSTIRWVWDALGRRTS